MPRSAGILNRQAARLRVYLGITRHAFQIWQKSVLGFAAMEKRRGKAMDLALPSLAHFLRNFPSDQDWKMNRSTPNKAGKSAAMEQGVARKSSTKIKLIENATRLIRRAQRQTNILMKEGVIAPSA